MGTTKTLLTFEEFERLPDRPGKRELVKGELIELPPAKKQHNMISTRLFKCLDSTLESAHARGDARALGAVYMEMGYLLEADGWLQPDISITHRDQPGDDYFE